MKKPTMVKYLECLTSKEKLVICYIVNNVHDDGDPRSAEIHLGLLPFLPVAGVVRRLRHAAHENGCKIRTQFINYRRICKEILSKMQSELDHLSNTVTMKMRLDPKKVLRHFGPHPERGKALPFLQKQKATVGVKWSLPKKQYVPDKDVLVTPCVALKPISAGKGEYWRDMWEVTVTERCRYTVEMWLNDKCR